MGIERRKFKRETGAQRKLALVEATLCLVAEQGVHGATVRAIAERADVTQGLIRHYFSSKEDLIVAAYLHHMTDMTEKTFAPATQQTGSHKDRLAAFVIASLTPPVVEPRSIALWASFLNMVQQDPRMKSTHEHTYIDFRDRLAALIRAALVEADQPAPAPRLRLLATACNAVIDGLWMEGGALPDAFGPDELPHIGLKSVGAIIGINLLQKAEQS
jgi:AcrR family transcriptional regulator